MIGLEQIYNALSVFPLSFVVYFSFSLRQIDSCSYHYSTRSGLDRVTFIILLSLLECVILSWCRPNVWSYSQPSPFLLIIYWRLFFFYKMFSSIFLSIINSFFASFSNTTFPKLPAYFLLFFIYCPCLTTIYTLQ